jgi:hypothetical protein
MTYVEQGRRPVILGGVTVKYLGWEVWEVPAFSPKAGSQPWRASSRGVEMCANSEDAIRRMVEQRCRDFPPNGHGKAKGVNS